MSLLKTLKGATTIADVAGILGFKAKALTCILYAQPNSSKYKEFDIPKKSGGVRHIAAPKGGLKLLQRRLADVLQDCLDEISSAADGNQIKTFGQASHGFKRNLSILTNAKKHRNRRYVFNVDLVDFFGSINFGRVRGFFIKDHRFHLNSKVATIFAQIACFNNTLPQGSPCSPVISNLIGNILDTHLVRLAAQEGCIYTRYADDLTFSTNKRYFPENIATLHDDKSHQWIPGTELLRLVKHSGFEINAKKTRMQYHSSRQEVTGLVVNKKINVRREYRHHVRAMVHHLFTKGNFFLPTYEQDSNGDSFLAMKRGTLNQLHGKLSFIDEIDRIKSEEFIRLNEQTKSKGSDISREHRIRGREQYRKFLFYKEFYAASKPLLICEGWTDYIYIENALRQLASNYPTLVSLGSNNKTNFLIKRFKYPNSNTNKININTIIGIKGGSGEFIKAINNFMSYFKSEIHNFSTPGMCEPVIILLDHDSGSDCVLQCVFNLMNNINSSTEDKKLASKKTQEEKRKEQEERGKGIDEMKSKAYIHVFRNLYLILTPLQENKKSSKIEDLFDSSTLSIKIDGKNFNPSNNDLSESEYGKNKFALEVVHKMASSINFQGFVPLLDRISKVIEDHYSQRIR